MWTKSLGLTLLLIATAGSMMAGIAVPEIGGPASGAGAVVLLSGALLVIRGRRGSKRTPKSAAGAR